MPLKQATTRPRSFRFAMEAVSYRIPLQVTQVRLFASGDSYAVCPRCGKCLDREYMGFCDICGQKLAWNVFPLAQVRPAGTRKRKQPL